MSLSFGPRHRAPGVRSPLYSGSASALGWLSYLGPASPRPVSYACEPPPGTPWENASYDTHPVLIEDIRLRTSLPHIDREGFELWHAPSSVRDFLDDEEVRATYYPELAELALAATGATRCHVFDHLVRRREAGRPALGFGRSNGRGPVAANGRIHNDYTVASGERRLALVVTDPEALLAVRRHAIVNIWRPIRHPVLDTPLALCDAGSVAPADLVEGEVRYANRNGEIYLLRHSSAHRWAFASALQPQEALVFKQYDSRADGVARFTPHTAFDRPVAPGTPLRESIEARVLVVYE